MTLVHPAGDTFRVFIANLATPATAKTGGTQVWVRPFHDSWIAKTPDIFEASDHQPELVTLVGAAC
jgi:hypothetical protein